jgi:hypothetical protein
VIICKFTIWIGSRVRVFYLRDEYQTNNIAGAHRYASLEQAENDADIYAENLRGMGYRVASVKFFSVE